MLCRFSASGRSCTFQEVRSSCCCHRCCSCAALPGPGSPESEIHQGPRQGFISTLNKKGSRVIICFKRFMVAGFYVPPRRNFPNRSVLQLMSKPSGEKRQSVTVPRSLSSWFHLWNMIPVLFCCIHAFFSALSGDSVCREPWGCCGASRGWAQARVKENKTSQATAFPHSDAQVRAPTLVSSTLELPRSVQSIRGAPTAGWGIRTSHGPSHLSARITTQPESVPRPHWCGWMSIAVSPSLGGVGVRGGGETAGILMSAVSQWKGRKRWQPAALTCDWYRVWVWIYWRGKVAGALHCRTWALNRGFVNKVKKWKSRKKKSSPPQHHAKLIK